MSSKLGLDSGGKLERIRKLGRSPWVFHVNTGGCNGCDIEIIDTLTPYFDAERFGVKRVSSPKHADILLVTGPVTRQSAATLQNAIEAAPDPKLIVAIGSCACEGGIFHDSFTVVGGLDKITPVDVYIPGCPPKPEALLHGLLLGLGKAEQKVSRSEYKEGPHEAVDNA
ncbi:MAG: NADH-quinone oxidoreductase subunit B family protein [Candidatus Bathyarchaeia archaeon]|jgi:Ni,Fe-hydrogenase III small subunit